jgi:hypothetical protein
MQLSTPEQLDEILRQLPQGEEQRNYLLQQSEADVQAWGEWKAARGETQEGPGTPIGDTGVVLGDPKRMPYSQANQAVADGLESTVDPQQLNQMKSMQAAADAASGKPSKEPEGLPSKGLLDNDLGMYLRAAATGATALPALPINLFTSMLPFGGDGDAVGAIIDQTGAKRPQTRDERIMSDIIAGVAGSGAVIGGGKALGSLGFKGAEKSLVGSPVSQLIGGGTGAAAAGTVREEGGSQTEQIIAALLAGGIPAGASMANRAAFTRGVDRPAMQERMANFEAAGTTPTIGQLTGGDKAQGTEAFLAQFYGSSPVIKSRLAAQEEAVLGANQKVADSLAPLDLATGEPVRMSKAELNNLIENTWNNSGKKAISQTRTDFANNLADKVSPRAGVGMSSFQDITDELTAIDPGAKNLSKNPVFNPNLKQFTELKNDLKKDLAASIKLQIAGGVPLELAKGKLPFEAVRKLKTQLGAQMDNSTFGAQNVSEAEQRRLFGAIAEDIKAFIKTQGVDAEAAFNDWNKWEINYHKEAAALRSVLGKNGGRDKVYKAAFAGVNEGPTIIKSVYNNLDKGARDALTGAWLSRAMKVVNKSDPDETSLGQMFGNYRNMSDEAKEVMFAPEVREQLDKLNSAARTILKSEKEFGMKAGGRSGSLGGQGPIYAGGSLISSGIGLASGTTSLAAGAEPATALFNTLAAIAGTAVGANILARYMTNPKTVRWMASNAKLPPAALPTAINLLSQEARKSQDPDMIEFARLMEEATAQKDGEE